MDFSIKLSNGIVLRGIAESPGENTKAVMILVHGLGDHVQRYKHWINLFKNEGISIVAVDLPGHGRSPGRRGHISSYNVVREMIDILLDTSKQTFSGIPVYIYGHSMGGGMVLDYLIRTNPGVAGAIVTSPWLKLANEPPKIKLVLASLLNHILPGFIQSSGLNADYISQDREVVRLYKDDPLVHGKISVRLCNISFNAAKFALVNSAELKVRTLLLQGSDDKIVSPQGSMEFAANAEKVDFKIFEGGYHELHNEPFKSEVFDYILKWINNKP
ncbi:MAG TPA: lysophospholipase [Bacteroidales bacterium]|nr:lysophospholipase [Bacteroidales bacterium]